MMTSRQNRPRRQVVNQITEANERKQPAMDTEPITNQNLMSADFARKKRIAFLKKIPDRKPPKAGYLAPGLPATGLIGTDVSAMDRRSVKAQLAVRGDARVFWWRLNCMAHHLLDPQTTLEQTMYAFHHRHHRWTIARLTFFRDVVVVRNIIQHHGIGAGLRHALDQVRADLKL
jgi:hypothetical protein